MLFVRTGFTPDVQDILGSIHDSDMLISYLRRLRHPNEVTNILHDEISERNKSMRILSSFVKEVYLITLPT